MKRLKKVMLLVLCVVMMALPAVMTSAAVTNGWDAQKIHYYKNGKAVTGLQKIGSYYYWFNSKGVVQKNVFKPFKQNNVSYTFYFGSDGRAYKAAPDEFYEAFVVKKINGKYYAFDSKSHRITGLWADNDGKVYYFNNGNAVLNDKVTNKLRALATYNKKSKTLLTDVKQQFGNPLNTRVSKNSCNAFDGYAAKYYEDYVLIYAHVEVQFTKNTKTGEYCMSGVFPREISSGTPTTPSDPSGPTPTPTPAPSGNEGWNADRTSYYKNGEKLKGLRTIDGKKYYFNAEGTLLKNKRIFKVTVKGSVDYYQLASDGVATKWTDTAGLAAKVLYDLNARSKSVESLKKAFLWSAEQIKYVNNTKSGLSDTKAAKYYGDYGFKNKRGDCNTQAYTFYWMAKVLGYNPKVIRGYIPTAIDRVTKQPTAFKSHAWAEIKQSNVTYAYDPTFNSSTDAKSFKAVNKYVGFQFKYGTKNTYHYYNAKKQPLA